MLLLIPQLTGCYQYVPVVDPQPPVGARVTASLTDRGRMDLADQIGPGVHRLNGTVASSTDSALVRSLRTIEYIDVPVPVNWNGGQLSVSRGLLNDLRERRLSKSRSWLMAGVAVLAVAGMSTVALTGFGGGSDSGHSGGGDTHQ
ncbi:MAG: hypothetical protein FIB01_16450 [Gemmatimonadetes bacterium]|nr:hypothetical protein [Gemmatimonadota bacterium]